MLLGGGGGGRRRRKRVSGGVGRGGGGVVVKRKVTVWQRKWSANWDNEASVIHVYLQAIPSRAIQQKAEGAAQHVLQVSRKSPSTVGNSLPIPPPPPYTHTHKTTTKNTKNRKETGVWACGSFVFDHMSLISQWISVSQHGMHMSRYNCQYILANSKHVCHIPSEERSRKARLGVVRSGWLPEWGTWSQGTLHQNQQRGSGIVETATVCGRQHHPIYIHTCHEHCNCESSHTSYISISVSISICVYIYIYIYLRTFADCVFVS